MCRAAAEAPGEPAAPPQPGGGDEGIGGGEGGVGIVGGDRPNPGGWRGGDHPGWGVGVAGRGCGETGPGPAFSFCLACCSFTYLIRHAEP